MPSSWSGEATLPRKARTNDSPAKGTVRRLERALRDAALDDDARADLEPFFLEGCRLTTARQDDAKHATPLTKTLTRAKLPTVTEPNAFGWMTSLVATACPVQLEPRVFVDYEASWFDGYDPDHSARPRRRGHIVLGVATRIASSELGKSRSKNRSSERSRIGVHPSTPPIPPERDSRTLAGSGSLRVLSRTCRSRRRDRLRIRIRS